MAVVPNEFDERITDLERKLEAKRVEAEHAAEAWQLAARGFLELRYTEVVTRAVTKDHPERAQELGRDALAALKNELANLISRLDSVVKEELDADVIWAHRGDLDDQKPHRYDDRLHRTALEEPVRRALGRVGPLLLERDLADSNSGWKEGESGIRWAYALDASPEMVERVSDYRDRLTELLQIDRALDEARREKREHEAQSLWDDA
jgi:hypothetical protein